MNARIWMYDENPRSGRIAVTTSVIFQPFTNAMTYALATANSRPAT